MRPPHRPLPFAEGFLPVRRAHGEYRRAFFPINHDLSALLRAPTELLIGDRPINHDL